MSVLASSAREARLLASDKAFWAWTVLVLALATFSVMSGLSEVREQRETIAQLLESDAADRADALSRQTDWGGAAYYSLHLTYDPPSEFAFAALGKRDEEPWKHRVKALAIEGQIYERDAGNPVLALVGRFDFAFFTAFVLPLVLCVLLHDLQSSERAAGRHALLVTTAGKSGSLWRIRAFLRSASVFAAAAVPLTVGGITSGTPSSIVIGALLALVAYVAFWSVLCLFISAWERPSAVLLATLLGTWVLLAVAVPAGGRLVADKLVVVPAGADILMTQREAVNDAWDLPKEATMGAFTARYPEWSDYAEIEQPFEWKWYYAFQQVGDQQTEELSAAYRSGREARDRMASLLAWISPPALIERTFQHLARTDLRAQLDYEARVRAFHAELRAFYYPRLFQELPYEEDVFSALPSYVR